MTEARHTERVRAILGAKVIFNGGQSTLSCQVRNISKVGAKLVMSDTVTLPQEFDIEIPQQGRTYRARLRWRNRDSAGIEFVQEGSGSSTAPNSSTRIAELEAENAVLKLRVADLTRKLEDALAASGATRAA